MRQVREPSEPADDMQVRAFEPKLQRLMGMSQNEVWRHFSRRVLDAYPFRECRRNALEMFLADGRGCTAFHHRPGARATRETVVMVDRLYGHRADNPRSMTNLKNHITHELCVDAFSKAVDECCPGAPQLFNAECVRSVKGGTRSDIFLSALRIHIEIKTEVWCGKRSHQHGNFESSDASKAVYCLFFDYPRAKVTVKTVGDADRNVLAWVSRVGTTCVLPVFLRWGEHLIHHSELVKQKRERKEKSSGGIYVMESWPSIDRDERSNYIM